MTSVVITRTTPVYRSPSKTGVFVQWDVESAPAEGISHFKLERAGGPDGPYEQVISNLDDYHFFDDLRNVPAPDTGVRENVNFLSLHRSIYYRVTATSTSGTDYVSSPVLIYDQLDRRNMLLRRKLQRDLSVALRFTGVPILVLKRRHWGTRCSTCFDLVTKSVTKPKCEECYGTSYTDGYWAPTSARGRLTVTAPQTSISSHGKTDMTQVRLYMLDYPVLEPDDVVIHTRLNRRYIIKHRTQTELQTVPVHQVLVMNELPRDSVEYRIPADLSVAPTIY